jgi:hypothetical protein
MAKQKFFIAISRRALSQRIKRLLAKTGEALMVGRGQNAGSLYVVDGRGNFVVKGDLDIEDLGRELGALRPFERLDGKATPQNA